MSSESIIDALVVTLSLDSKTFNDGIEKAVGSLTGFATKIAGLALGFEGLAAGIKYFENLNQKMADLEITARNFGIFGTQLNKMGELAQLFGGKFDDAKSSVEGLQGAVYNLKFHGQMSEQLQMLQRFGVKYLDPSGHVRDQVDLARAVAGAIDRQSLRTPGGLEPGLRRQMALDLLGSGAGGLANAAAAGAAKFDEVWATVKKDQKGLTEKMLRDNAKPYQDTTIHGRTEREIARMPLLEKLIPAFEGLNDELTDLTARAIPYLTKGIDDLRKIISGAAEAEKKIAAALGKLKTDTTLPPTRPGEKPVDFLSPLSYTWRLGEQISDQVADKIARMLGVPYVPYVPPPVPQTSKPPMGSSSEAPRIPHSAYHAPVTPLAPRPPTSGSSTPPTSMNERPATNITFDTVNVFANGNNGNALADAFVERSRRKLIAATSERGLA